MIVDFVNFLLPLFLYTGILFLVTLVDQIADDTEIIVVGMNFSGGELLNDLCDSCACFNEIVCLLGKNCSQNLMILLD